MEPRIGLIQEAFGKLISSWAAQKIDAFLGNEFMPEMITLAIVFCGFGMMITGKVGLWGGRAFIILWLGVTILMVR